jgi:hypothetical protein
MFVAQIGCAACGVLALSLFGPGWVARGAALSACIAFMTITGSAHPPGKILNKRKYGLCCRTAGIYFTISGLSQLQVCPFCYWWPEVPQFAISVRAFPWCGRLCHSLLYCKYTVPHRLLKYKRISAYKIQYKIKPSLHCFAARGGSLPKEERQVLAQAVWLLNSWSRD